MKYDDMHRLGTRAGECSCFAWSRKYVTRGDISCRTDSNHSVFSFVWRMSMPLYFRNERRELVRRLWTWAWWSCPLSRAAIAAICSPAPIPAKAMAWSDLSEFLLLMSDTMLGNLRHSDGSEESTHILSTRALQNSREKFDDDPVLESFEWSETFRMNIQDLVLWHSKLILPSMIFSSTTKIKSQEP